MYIAEVLAVVTWMVVIKPNNHQPPLSTINMPFLLYSKFIQCCPHPPSHILYYIHFLICWDPSAPCFGGPFHFGHFGHLDHFDLKLQFWLAWRKKSQASKSKAEENDACYPYPKSALQILYSVYISCYINTLWNHDNIFYLNKLVH